MRNPPTTLGIDRGSKFVGLAYMIDNNPVIFPVGYLYNDKMLYFNIADLITRHRVKTIVIGRPTKQEDIQEKIKAFIQ
jgi:RNase H-fold protein (predicted Holliday junction resolvase)